jgi:predicted transcriptional regulator
MTMTKTEEYRHYILRNTREGSVPLHDLKVGSGRCGGKPHFSVALSQLEGEGLVRRRVVKGQTIVVRV